MKRTQKFIQRNQKFSARNGLWNYTNQEEGSKGEKRTLNGSSYRLLIIRQLKTFPAGHFNVNLQLWICLDKISDEQFVKQWILQVQKSLSENTDFYRRMFIHHSLAFESKQNYLHLVANQVVKWPHKSTLD